MTIFYTSFPGNGLHWSIDISSFLLVTFNFLLFDEFSDTCFDDLIFGTQDRVIFSLEPKKSGIDRVSKSCEIRDLISEGIDIFVLTIECSTINNKISCTLIFIQIKNLVLSEISCIETANYRSGVVLEYIDTGVVIESITDISTVNQEIENS